MELESFLAVTKSKSQMLEIVDWVGSDSKRFNQLARLALEGDFRTAQKASWPLSNCTQHFNVFTKRNYRILLERIRDTRQHPAVRRHLLKILLDAPVPLKYEGELMDLCISSIEDPQEAIAVQYYALIFLEKFVAKYPEILPEIKYIIETRWPHASSAFKGRAGKLLKQ